MLIAPVFLSLLATVFDLRSRTIPDWIPALLLLWALASLGLGWSPTTWLGALMGLGISLVAGGLSFRVGVLGGGDVKFLMALGAAVGPALLVLTLFLTAISGALMAIVVLIRGEKEMPYMPAIAMALIVLSFLIKGALSW